MHRWGKSYHRTLLSRARSCVIDCCCFMCLFNVVVLWSGARWDKVEEKGTLQSSPIYVCIHIYIYRERETERYSEREREREILMYLYIYIYICTRRDGIERRMRWNVGTCAEHCICMYAYNMCIYLIYIHTQNTHYSFLFN